MTRTATTFSGEGTFPHGVHPPERKGLAADAAIEVLPTPAQVNIPLLQHVGATCVSIVKPKQELTLGERIADSEAFISAPIHAGINGTAGMQSVATLPNGRHVPAVPIKAAEEQPTAEEIFKDVLGGDWPTRGLEQYAPEKIVEAAKTAGLVGQGGAAFPTHVKLKYNPEKPIDTILLNGCECEPYLTADYRMMVETPAPIITGALLAARACSAKRVLIAVEDNKPLAVDTLQQAAKGTDVRVVVLKTKYPQGGEKQTIFAALGRIVPQGGLPLDVGVVVINVGTAAALARAVLRGKPLTHRVICVTGAGIVKPKNLLAPIGASYRDLIDYCGGLKPTATRVIAGGPMMGFTLGNLDTPVTKGTSGVTVLTEEDTRRPAETNCVRCGRCVDACPMHLVPTRIALASRGKDWDLAKKYHITSCVECGCCAYVCPASLPLVQLIRMGKAQMPRE
ncbi:MAG: electron transport complex subunit RsxC [Phycisphaerae bacterium]|nr:electron transport complex subunit RsxC [Phycisphaerae bacterium]